MTEQQPGEMVGAPPRRHDYTQAVYGSVLAATVIVSSGDSRGPFTLAVLLMVSGIVFWLAHVYAATVSSVHGGWHAAAIRTGLRHEWPVAAAAVPPAVAALICGWIPNISPSDGVWIAFLVAIAEQQLWGIAAVRHAGLTGTTLTRTVALNFSMGIVIVVLKLAIPAH